MTSETGLSGRELNRDYLQPSAHRQYRVAMFVKAPSPAAPYSTGSTSPPSSQGLDLKLPDVSWDIWGHSPIWGSQGLQTCLQLPTSEQGWKDLLLIIKHS